MKTDMHFDESWDIWFGDNLLTDYFYVQDITGRELPNYEISTLTVPNMPGSMLQSKRLQSTPISIKAVMIYDTEEDLREAYNELSGLLDSDQPGMMTFSDEPEFSYYVTYASCDASEQKGSSQKITLNFFRGDPYKYGLEQTRQFDSDQLSIINDGTAETYPVYTVTPSERVTHIDIANERGEYMRIGTPMDVDDTPTERKTELFLEGMDSLTGWTDGTSVDNGTIAGQIQSSNGFFEAYSYGTGTGWHGPAEKKAISEPIQDFLLEAHIRNIATSRDQIGRIEVALLDASNNQVGKVMMAKWKEGSWQNNGRVQAGEEFSSHYIINTHGEKETTWTEFNGKLELSRIGDRWSAYIAYYDTNLKRYDRRAFEVWYDEQGDYTAPVTQVQVYIAQYDDKPTTRMECYTTAVFRYNGNLLEYVPWVAEANDEITFDHQRKDILINGDSIFSERFSEEPEKGKDFGASFFPLHKGSNHLYAFPSGKLDVSMDYRSRFL